MPVYRLNEQICFPDPRLAEADGFLAVGGDLSEERLLLAYTNGIFPWYNPGDMIQWWCPHERFVIIPGEIKVSGSMKKFIRKTDLSVTFNRDFQSVMHECRLMREQEGTWIGDEMEAAYNRLFQDGYAMSAEVWRGNLLAGGLYGVCIGRCFFGESMFSKVTNASKLALIGLAGLLEKYGFVFIDCQFHTDHLESMGGRYLSYEAYMELMDQGIRAIKTDK